MEFEKNPDGTDKLDEEGNPIPKVTYKDEEAAKVNAQLVEEIKQLRLEKGVSEALLKEKSEVKPQVDPNKVLTDEEKLDALLDKKIKERDALNAKANKTAAFEKFITENKEFHPDNDPLGLKKDALQKKFNRFNTDDLTSLEEFYSVIGDAKNLLIGNDNQSDTTKVNQNPYSNPTKTVNNPNGKREEELTPKELKLAQTTGKTKEQILKLKLKNPGYLRELLEYVRD